MSQDMCFENRRSDINLPIKNVESDATSQIYV